MPLQRRLPKRGFTNKFKKQYQVVNLKALENVKSSKALTPEKMLELGLIGKKGVPVKILGDGELKKAVEVSAHAFSASAKEKIEKAGGKVTLL